jgi:hypothetical protein
MFPTKVTEKNEQHFFMSNGFHFCKFCVFQIIWPKKTSRDGICALGG